LPEQPAIGESCPSISRYGLGCPFWSFEHWRGTLYTRDAQPRDRLKQYASVFNAVEGNTTFYSVPSHPTILRWREAVPKSFEFCLKLPQPITHERMLEDIEILLDDFVQAVEPLGDRLGPFLVQLPPAFGPAQLGALEVFLEARPSGFQWAVELRHAAFFEDDSLAEDCDELLAEHGCDRVMMDTRALRAGEPTHPEALSALHKKPDLPLRPEPIGARPMVRFVGHPEPAVNDEYLDEWAARLADWIERGLEPIFFVHTASNRHTPETARDLHERISSRLDVGELPGFPGELGEGRDGQLSLL